MYCFIIIILDVKVHNSNVSPTTFIFVSSYISCIFNKFTPRSSCHSVSVQQKPCLPHCCPDSVVKLPLKIDGPPHWTVSGFPKKRSRCSMLFWKGGVPKCSKRFWEENCKKIVSTKVSIHWHEKCLLQQQLSNFLMDLNLNLPFFASNISKIHQSLQLSDPGCWVESRVGHSTGIISGTTSPQGEGFVIAHRHWCSRWLSFYPKDHHQPVKKWKKQHENPPLRPHGCVKSPKELRNMFSNRIIISFQDTPFDDTSQKKSTRLLGRAWEHTVNVSVNVVASTALSQPATFHLCT